MNWRTWIFPKLQTVMSGLGHAPASVFAGSSLEAVPAIRPFIVYRIQDSTPRIRDGFTSLRDQRRAEIWVYDNPGSYDRIEVILDAAKAALQGQVSVVGGIACEWTGDGPELSDDEMKAAVRVGNYNLIGVS